MDDIDRDNVRLLRKGVNMLLRRACNALAENKAVSDEKGSKNPLKIFGNSSPIHTFEGTARLMAVLSHLDIGGEPSDAPPFSDEDRELVETLLAHTQKMIAHQPAQKLSLFDPK